VLVPAACLYGVVAAAWGQADLPARLSEESRNCIQSMMAPDYTHWHGTYELAKHFYMKLIPELRSMVRRGLASNDPDKVKAARKLAEKLAEVLNRPDNRWSIDKMDPVEKERRNKAREEFLNRYKKKSS